MDSTPIRKNFRPASFERRSLLRNADIRNPGRRHQLQRDEQHQQVARGRHQQAAQERGQQQEVVLALVEAALAEVAQRDRQHDHRHRQEEDLERAARSGRARTCRRRRRPLLPISVSAATRDASTPSSATGMPSHLRRAAEEHVDDQHQQDRAGQDQLRQDRVVVDDLVHRAPSPRTEDTRRCTALSVTPKIKRGKSPRTMIPTSSGTHATHSTARMSRKPVLLPALGHDAHVHALQHPQEVARREHGADAAGDHEAAEQRRRQAGRRVERRRAAPSPRPRSRPGPAARARRSRRTRRSRRASASSAPCRRRSPRSRACGSGRRSTRRRRTACR